MRNPKPARILLICILNKVELWAKSLYNKEINVSLFNSGDVAGQCQPHAGRESSISLKNGYNHSPNAANLASA